MSIALDLTTVPDGPWAMEACLHVEAWRRKCPKTTGFQNALEFEVRLCQGSLLEHQRIDWSSVGRYMQAAEADKRSFHEHVGTWPRRADQFACTRRSPTSAASTV